MVKKKQYEELKKFVTARFVYESAFYLSYFELKHNFGITQPCYRQLTTFIEEDGTPFHIEGDGEFDLNGDPSVQILFESAYNTNE